MGNFGYGWSLTDMADMADERGGAMLDAEAVRAELKRLLAAVSNRIFAFVDLGDGAGGEVVASVEDAARYASMLTGAVRVLEEHELMPELRRAREMVEALKIELQTAKHFRDEYRAELERRGLLRGHRLLSGGDERAN